MRVTFVSSLLGESHRWKQATECGQVLLARAFFGGGEGRENCSLMGGKCPSHCESTADPHSLSHGEVVFRTCTDRLSSPVRVKSLCINRKRQQSHLVPTGMSVRGRSHPLFWECV